MKTITMGLLVMMVFGLLVMLCGCATSGPRQTIGIALVDLAADWAWPERVVVEFQHSTPGQHDHWWGNHPNEEGMRCNWMPDYLNPY